MGSVGLTGADFLLSKRIFYTIPDIHSMKVIKCVKQPHNQQASLAMLFAYFHWAVNESVRPIDSVAAPVNPTEPQDD